MRASGTFAVRGGVSHGNVWSSGGEKFETTARDRSHTSDGLYLDLAQVHGDMHLCTPSYRT
jgi:hypothetical protein